LFCQDVLATLAISWANWKVQMANIMSILQSAYAATPQSLIAPGSKFANVDPTKWQGTWTGTDDKKQPVTVSITRLAASGLTSQSTTLPKACKVQGHSSPPTTRFGVALTGTGKARLTTIVTDPTTGNQSRLTVPLTLKT
jgi:hypothetical protein